MSKSYQHSNTQSLKHLVKQRVNKQFLTGEEIAALQKKMQNSTQEPVRDSVQQPAQDSASAFNEGSANENRLGYRVSGANSIGFTRSFGLTHSFSLAACIALLVLGGWLLVDSEYVKDDAEYASTNVEEEAGWSKVIADASTLMASNHIQPKPMEVISDQFSDFADHFNMLDFKLIEPRKMTQNGKWQLVAGRYTSILGEDAAHIQLREVATGNVQSLYQAKLTSQHMLIADAGDVVTAVDGVKLKLWVDDGVLCAVTLN